MQLLNLLCFMQRLINYNNSVVNATSYPLFEPYCTFGEKVCLFCSEFDLCSGFFSVSSCRNVTLEKEIFPAATDSRFIRAVSVCKNFTRGSLCMKRQLRGWSPASALGGHPCHRLFSHEPDAHPAARPQRVPERAGLPERHRGVRAAHPGSRQRPCPPRRGLDHSLIIILSERH